MKNAGFLLLIISVVNVSAVPVDVAADLKSENVVFKIKPRFIQNGGSQASLSGVLFKTVVRYYCSIPLFNEGSVTILYGTKGWTFPEQDVNLTLSYPTTDTETRLIFENYRISGYEVLLFTDGSESTGVIVSGGLMQDHITLNFAMSGITLLSYEFWLYGVPAVSKGGGIAGPHQNYNLMCI